MSEPKIPHDTLEALGHAANAVEQCFRRAVSIIDGNMGHDYAKKNPGLLASVTSTIASEFQSGSRDSVLERIADAVDKLP